MDSSRGGGDWSDEGFDPWNEMVIQRNRVTL